MNTFGVRYQPGADAPPFTSEREQHSQTTVPQQAIRTLSLRVPQTTSVPGIAPLPLLNAAGGGGTDLDMLLMALLKAFAPSHRGAATGSGPPGQSMMGLAPLPTPPRSTPRLPRILPSGVPGGDDREAPLAELPPTGAGFAPTGSGSGMPSWLANKYESMNLSTPLQPLF
jgi:hypothetical protein